MTHQNQKFFTAFIFNIIGFGLLEVIFRILSNQPLAEFSFIRTLLFATVFSLIFAWILTFLSRKGSTIVFLSFLWISSIYSFAQLGFRSYLGYYFSLAILKRTIGGVAEFAGDFLGYIRFSYYLIFIPAILFSILLGTKQVRFTRKKPKRLFMIGSLAITLLIHLISIWSLNWFVSATTLHKPKDLYDTPLFSESAIRQLGIGRFALRDATLLFKDVEDDIIFEPTDPTPVEPVEPDLTRYVKTELWESLASKETNSRIKQIDDYLLSRHVSPKNEMTGYFEGKNLVYIMVEAFDYMAINETLTPTLYKMMNEGWLFENYYAPKHSCSTGESEFMSQTSLIPSTTVCTPNEYYKNNWNPALFNLFSRRGFETKSFHSWTDQFYPRRTWHQNMGSSKFYNFDDLNIDPNNTIVGWPSDINLMEEVFPIMDQMSEPFMSMIITVSMHFPYDMDSTMGNKYLSSVNQVYPDAPSDVKRYMSKAIEFDRSMQRLFELFEASGKMDDTVFVIFADHHPFKMSTKSIADYTPWVNRNVGLSMDRSPLILYHQGSEPQKFNMPASTMDLVPTMANLFNLNFDPRMYLGVDLFSNEKAIVIFPTGSWVDSIGEYYSSNGTFHPYNEEVTYTDEEISALNQKVRNHFAVSEEIYKTNYFDLRRMLLP